MRCSPTVDVDRRRLKPYVERPADLPPPGPAADAGQEGEQEVVSASGVWNRRASRR
jgi:hypothetical protein